MRPAWSNRTNWNLLGPTMLSMKLTARPLALGLMDSLISQTLALGSLLTSKTRTWPSRSGADPNGNAGLVFRATEMGAPVLRSTLAGHLTTLESYGIELVDEQATFSSQWNGACW